MTFRRAAVTLSIACILVGCSQNDPQEVKRQAAEATSQIKKGSEVAAGDLKDGAKVLRQDTKAAAEGIKEGWNSNTAKDPQLRRRERRDNDADVK